MKTKIKFLSVVRNAMFAVICFAVADLPSSSHAADNFQVAAQLLAAAKNADIAQVQSLVNNGADINFVDNTGLSIVCTALMNKDVRAAQILQMYGADASRCDLQIKKFNKKQPKTESGGLFGGLSTAQSMALSAAGAAVVVGGVLLLSGAFGGGKGGGGAAAAGDRPNNSGNNNNNNNGGSVTPGAAMPFGPAMPNAAAESANYVKNLNLFSPPEPGIMADNFFKMNNETKQNYLLIMHGYSPLARGYLGMRTLRNTGTGIPLDLTTINLGSERAGGGRPINIALVTDNGINAVAGSSLGDEMLVWTSCNGDNCAAASVASNDMISSKYYNNTIKRGDENGSVTDDKITEDSSMTGIFDLSGHGTAINNSNASAMDDLLAKIVGGKSAGYTFADYVGFMPNGQMTIFRTGGGFAFDSVIGKMTDVDDSKTWNNGDTIKVGEYDYTITLNDDGTFIANGNYGPFSGRKEGALLHLDDGSEYEIMSDGTINKLKKIDYMNYRALWNAGLLWASDRGDLGISAGQDVPHGRSRPDIIANTSIVPELHARDAKTVEWIMGSTAKANDFLTWINDYYNRATDDGTPVSGTGLPSDAVPATDAESFFTRLGSLSGFSPLVVFGTGGFETDSYWAGPTLVAGFENAAPLVFDNLEHLFASVVAVGITGTGTACSTGTGCSVSGYKPGGRIALSQWLDNQGTADTGDDKYYKARSCGIAGTGTGTGGKGIDPWCFAAAGLTDEMAVASFAGAAGAIKGAFDYMDSKQVFALLALTADGAYLGSNGDGRPGSLPTAWTAGGLESYLKNLYELPADAQARVDYGEDYLTVFKEVFGYGLVNLERATKPGSKIYYYGANNDIVTVNGDSYWRSASVTRFGLSGAFGARSASISAPFYDVLESVDGALSMPRVWENEFSLTGGGRRGLYMGDVLGDLVTEKAQAKEKADGLSFDMSFGESNRSGDNLNGLANINFGFVDGNYEFGAKFQHYLSDFDVRPGIMRGDLDNPILSLASNAMSSDAKIKSGNWSFGARAFSGQITDETLLENDPTLTSQFTAARLGMVSGAESKIGWTGDKLSFGVGAGTVHESDTVLGAYTNGLLGLGGGDTTYIDTIAGFAVTDNVKFTARATFAKTSAAPNGEFVTGLSDIESNAFGFGMDAGNLSFMIAQPLAVRNGAMRYATGDYSVVENADGNYELDVNPYLGNLDLSPDVRETRFSATYRFGIDETTNAAVGMIYRLNPNHTDEFGNESILMMKLRHSW